MLLTAVSGSGDGGMLVVVELSDCRLKLAPAAAEVGCRCVGKEVNWVAGGLTMSLTIWRQSGNAKNAVYSCSAWATRASSCDDR